MTGPAVFTRQVSPTERFYLAGAALAPPFAIQVFVEGYGRIDLDALRAAVAAAGCPGARLVRRGRLWTDSGRPPPVSLVDRAAIGLDGAALRRPLDAAAGPSCEVLLCADGAGSGDGAGCTVVFRAFHAVMDGRGALIWADQVFRALRGEAAVPARERTTDAELLERLGTTGSRARLGLGWPSPLPTAAPARGFSWRRRSLDGSSPALVAKVAAVVSAAVGPRPSRLMVPVDLRRHLGGDAATGTANLTLPIFLDARGGEPWEELHQQLLGALADRRELARGAEGAAARVPLRALRRTLALANAASVRRGSYLCSSIVSHLGRVDPAAFSVPGFTAAAVFSLPTHAPFAPVSLVAVESPGRTELTLSCPRGTAVEAEADALLDRIAAALSPPGLRTWPGNRTELPYPAHETVTSLFRRRVDASPDAVALAGPEGEVTYAELDRRADAVAAELRARGVSRGHVVALVADRTMAAMAGLWGILKAGAAYLPVDPAYPDHRIGYLLADADARVCLAGRAQRDRVEPVAGACRLMVLEDLPAGGAPRAEPGTGPDDLAYVIYTSGSTGRPKGVQIEHRSLVNYVTWATPRYRVDPGTRFALFTSLAFDLTGTAIFLPLLAGGSIALVPGELTHVSLRQMLAGSGANALKLTPAHLDLIGRLDAAPAGYRVLVVGGEQLRGPVAGRAQQLFGPECRIVNEYGPTEATIGCVVHDFDPERDGPQAAVPVGAPVGNTRVFLMDEAGSHVPPGAAGELYLAGAQLARGYLGRPDEDRQRFRRLADGTRVYRTGDLARLLPTGALEYLGRSDDQIKVRGHRVEPGEVAAALEEDPAVRRALVVGRPRPAGDGMALCAYVVAGPELSERRLLARLADRLPGYLVPAAVVPIAELPHTPNGKVDLRALPDPFAGSPVATGAAAPRRDGIEEAVAKIWSETLGTDLTAIGPGADFHRLGGDSLTLLAMIAAVAGGVVGTAREELFMAGLPDLIRTPTLDRVCQAVRQAHGADPQESEEQH